MKKRIIISLMMPTLFLACGDDENGIEAESTPAWEASLDSETPLEDLSSEEIAEVCGSLTDYLSQFERELACSTRAIAETASTKPCEESIETCDVDSPDLDEYLLPSAPTVINCEVFTTEAVAGCKLPLSELETCVSGLRSGVEKTQDALSCESASDINAEQSIENTRTTKNSFLGEAATACDPLAEPCMGLLEAIIGN